MLCSIVSYFWYTYLYVDLVNSVIYYFFYLHKIHKTNPNLNPSPNRNMWCTIRRIHQEINGEGDVEAVTVLENSNTMLMH